MAVAELAIRCQELSPVAAAVRGKMTSEQMQAGTGPAPGTGILAMAAWFGLITGLVEGSALLLFQRLHWLTWDIAQRGVSAEIIWISCAFDLVLFGVAGLVLCASGRMLRRDVFGVATFLFIFLMCFDWLVIIGRIRHYAIALLSLGVASLLIRWFQGHRRAAAGIWRRSLPAIAIVAVLAFAGIQGGQWAQERIATSRLPAAPPGSPNILIIVVDTLRADHLSIYGYKRATSPNLERIAANAVLFEHAIAPSSWTLPSHASLLTGLYPHQHGVQTGEDVLDGRYPTLPAVLQARGYRTGAFSGNTFWFSRPFGFGRGFMHFEDFFASFSDMWSRTIYGREFFQKVAQRLGYEDYPGRLRAADINEHALRWINRDRQHPFFAFLNYFDVHDPYLPPQPYRSRFSKVQNPGGLINEALHGWPKLTPQQLESEISAYDGAVAYVDVQISKLLDELRSKGLAESTIVIISSDHGEAFDEHGELGHRKDLYRESIEVPLIISWPGHLPAGTQVSYPVSNAWIPATLMELLGVFPSAFHSPSLLLSKDAAGDRPYPLAELAQMPFAAVKETPAYSGWLKSLVSPDWHFIVHQKHGAELYDFRNDATEQNNLAATPQGRVTVSDFAEHLRSLMGHQLSETAKLEKGPAARARK